MILVGLAVWWVGGFNFGGSARSQVGAAAGALLTSDTYAIVSDTWTNSLNTGLETAVNGGVCYTNPPATAPVSINGVTVTPLSVAVVPCPAQVGLDQASALATLNSQSCMSLGTNVTLDSTMIGTNPPGTFPPGCYSSTGTMDITASATLTLDATAPGGDGGNVWIFRSGGALTTGANSLVLLANGANAANVFWTPGGTASIGANSATSPSPTFVGTIIADALGSTGINVGHFVNLLGRVLAFGHTVTTDSDTITAPPPSPILAPATLHIITSVVNVSGTATPPDFTIHVISATSSVDVAGSPLAGTSTPGTLYTLPAGTYSISEDVNPLFPTYHQTFGLSCMGGSVTLGAGQDLICTVINTDIPVPAPVAPSSGGGGGGASAPTPIISVTKVPTPLDLPAGPGLVTYIYTVKNIGPVPMIGVWVKDDTCSPATYISGDTNNDTILDVGESWVYRCMQTVSQTVTNTVTVHGQAGGQDAYDTALATVVVGAPVSPPLIAIAKVPSRLTPFPFGGGLVTYTYTVTNPGVVAMHDVAVTDDKCAPVSFVSGDVNANNLLEPGESWIYNCSTNISQSTMNTATAKGTANGIIALDYAFATVLVGIPGLPNTGFPPRQ